jgi:uncharacterized protein (TIGR03435 family)
MKAIFAFGFLAMLPAFAQPPKFEIADVHASLTQTSFLRSFGGVIHGQLYVNRDATMLSLIAAAYGVSEDNIAGGPGWISSELFDVIAKVPNGTTRETANLMLQDLLADRFGLAVHHGTNAVPRYVLTVSKIGSKLRPASESGTPGCQPQQQKPTPPAGNPGESSTIPNIKWSCHNLTGAAIAENLRRISIGNLEHDVIDSTKLEGSWDFDLEVTPRFALAAKGSSGISFFDAVEKQLGLKLDQQNVELPSLVIDHVNRKPTETSAAVATALALPPARFEAASVKLANPDHSIQGIRYAGGSQLTGGGNLRFLIAIAMQIPPNIANEMIVGLPKSADTQQWEFTAKLPSSGEGAPDMVSGRIVGPPIGVMVEMLQGMLIDSFELKTHTESREVTVYALTLAGNKPKMMQAQDSDRAGCQQDASAVRPLNAQIAYSCKNRTMAEVARDLQRAAPAYIDYPIVDATGLQGGWNFVLAWTPRYNWQREQASNPNAPAGTAVDAADPNGISVFEAVEKELGLKLVKQKRSVPVVVVDHVDEKPIV